MNEKHEVNGALVFTIDGYGYGFIQPEVRTHNNENGYIPFLRGDYTWFVETWLQRRVSMVVDHSEKMSAANAMAETATADEAPTPCDKCLQRAFGTLALRTAGGSPDAAMQTIGDAQETWTSSGRTRATIYRCVVEHCSHAVLSFTPVDAPSVPDPANLHVEHLPGTTGCILPAEEPEHAT